MPPPSRWLLVALLSLVSRPTAAQELTAFDRSGALDMPAVVHDDITHHYFDPAIGGVDLTANLETPRARIKRATRVEELRLAIAQATIQINDHHTLFFPPGLVVRADVGRTMAFVGDTCRVTWVEPGSDADRLGLARGDAVFQIEGIRPTRGSLFYDGQSASASEAFVRSVQLTGRATILGDRSAAALRTARADYQRSGTQTVVPYGTEVAVEAFILPDGSSVEGVGVRSEEVVLPSGADLREWRDPGLPRALAPAGTTRAPERAGRLVWTR